MEIRDKQCSLCKGYKPIYDFNNQTKAVDGKMAYCRDCQKIDKAKRRYNISEKEYLNLMEIKNCEICGIKLTSEFTPLRSKRVIDHNHASGKLRGVLCSHCNTGIGLLMENKEILINAIRYLDDNA